MKRILMQKVFADRAGGFQLQAISGGQRIHTNQFYDFVQLRFLLQKAHQLLFQFRPVFMDVAVKPLGGAVGVQRIAGQPVDGREVAGVGQRRIQAPEYLYNAQGCLGDRFGDIAARGGIRLQ